MGKSDGVVGQGESSKAKVDRLEVAWTNEDAYDGLTREKAVVNI